MSQPALRTRLLVTVIFLGLALAAMAAFLAIYAPDRRPQPTEPFTTYDRTGIQAAMSPAAVQTELDRILALGSRFMGDPGFYATERHVRAAFAEAGLDIYELHLRSPVPRTIDRQIFDAAGQPLRDVMVYPFLPNHFQPMVTPAEGLTGELVLMSDELLLTRRRFDNCIALLDVADPPQTYGLQWQRYAELGVKAVIVAHRDGLEALTTDQWSGLTSALIAPDPLNYVRLAADGDIFAHVGQSVTVCVRVEFQPVDHRTLVGVLRAGRPARQALVITANYDAYSVLPDRSPGVLQAHGLASQLALVRGLAAHREQLRRDVVFVSSGARFMAGDGDAQLLAALGPRYDPHVTRLHWEEQLRENTAQRDQVTRLRQELAGPGFLVDVATTRARLDACPEPVRAFFNQQLRHVLNTVVFEESERLLQARLAFQRDPTQSLDGAPYQAYLAAKRTYDQAFSAAGLNANRLLTVRAAFATAVGLRDRVERRLAELAAFHDARHTQLDQRLTLNRRLRAYDNLVVLAPELTVREPASEREGLSFSMGGYAELRFDGPTFQNLLLAALRQSGQERHVDLLPYTRDHHGMVWPKISGVPGATGYWSRFGYAAVAIVNTDRQQSYGSFSYPLVQPHMRQVDTAARSLQVFGELALFLSYGNGDFPEPTVTPISRFSGRVFVSGIGESIVPNYPLAGALVAPKGPGFQSPGYWQQPFLYTDVYGRYELMFSPASFIPGNSVAYSPEAAWFGADGRIAYIKDEGEQAQSVYKSVGLNAWFGNMEDVHVVTFRAAPVTVLDLINPQTMQNYTGVDLVRVEGLDAFPKRNVYRNGSPVTTWISPDERFYVTLKAGAPENELVQTVRALMLGEPETAATASAQEISGHGYLAADTPFLLKVPFETARSLAALNDRRLGTLRVNRMADVRTVAFQDKARALLQNATDPDLSQHEAILTARDSATYSILNYPVIRNAIFEAIYGILWYLGLLVPFVFFFEKLVCGFTDIRQQLTAHAVIFLVVFALLKWLHPAFEMIRSSLMILLGFIIFLISMGVIALLSGRFQENLEALKRKRAQVTAAEVNRMGVIGTAFALGLNNMHRRKVRTGLTCATLVLITFAMLCFTTLHSNIVDSATAIGRAPYQGFLVKPEKFIPVSDAETFALGVKYGHRHTVVPRQLWVGSQGWTREAHNAEFTIGYSPAGQTPRLVNFDSVIGLTRDEPLAARLRLLAGRGWFTTADARRLDVAGPLPILLPDGLAKRLGLTPAVVATGEPEVVINGRTFRVTGIFDGDAFGALTDLDGRNLLPFDITAMAEVRFTGRDTYLVVADDADPRVSPHNVIIAPQADLGVTVRHGQLRTVSLAVILDRLPYREAREEIGQFLEQTGKSIYYGLDGVAYLGRRTRETSLAGLLDLLIPLAIASITVLNTMRGSVYERRDEIFVYNAVGIAPRHIFFMFIAEALVYAVVGTVLGYLLAQGLGQLLTVLGWTGGLELTFTSKMTVYVSLAIILATLVSTYFPARSALEIAAPAEDAGWRLPEPDGDTLSFALPFTFDHHDRIAILAFFHRYFLDHGEGSSASFFAGPPRLGLSERTDPLAHGGPIPEIRTNIWLKPFDLGVSQELVIDLETDPETREYIARITLNRLSGMREAWTRLNVGFVSNVRRHFLHWRAVGPEDRQELFTEARALLEQPVPEGSVV